MGNYRFDDDIHKEKKLPAGQRGIGCGIMIILPLLSYLAAIILLEIPEIKKFFRASVPSLFGTPNIHPLLWRVKSITPLLRTIQSWKNVEVNILFGMLILLFLTGIISVIYAIVFRAMAPPRYSGTNAPPIRRKSKKKSR